MAQDMCLCVRGGGREDHLELDPKLETDGEEEGWFSVSPPPTWHPAFLHPVPWLDYSALIDKSADGWLKRRYACSLINYLICKHP